MAPRRCCCYGSGGCTIFRDEFNRADSSSLGANWDSSSFEIFSNRVRTVGAGIAICQVPHPTPSESMAVTIETVDENEGDVYEVLVNVIDEDNYHLARFNRNGLATSTIELYKISGGITTLITSDVIISLTGTAREFTAIIADNEFCAYVSFAVVSLVFGNPTVHPGGYLSGFGCQTPGALLDNFEFEHHLQTKETCPSCVCQCENYYVPPCLNMHLEGTGRLGTLNCDITLTWNRMSFYWEGSGTCCGIDWDVILNCGNGESWDSFTLFLVSTQCAVGDFSARVPASGACEPFLAVFGPYGVPEFDLACICDGNGAPNPGTWTATITECA